METKPIKPNAEPFKNKDYELNIAIDFINTQMINRNWHDQLFDDLRKGDYEAIILPYGKYNNVMDRVVEKFKAEGWDCKWSSAYDARGPHYCFYVHKKHF